MPQPTEGRRRDPATGAVGGAGRIVRFDGVERATHWAIALLFAILIVTALPLYFGSLGSVVGRRELLARIHLWAGLMLPVPVLLALVGPWGARLRRDVRRVNLWTRDEIRWLRALGRDAPAVVDKFNPGQKLNTIFTGGAILVMLATGAILEWFGPFPVSWRTGATFVHDLLALTVVVVVTGHVLLAVAHPAAMRSMVSGWVTRPWAADHAPGWLEDQPPAPTPGPPAGTGGGGGGGQPARRRLPP